MSFNFYNVPILDSSPVSGSLPIYCELGKFPTLQMIIAVGQSITSIELTDGVNSETISPTITYQTRDTFRVVTIKQISFTPTLTGSYYIKITVGSDIFYSPYIVFSDIDCLHKIEFWHHEPIMLTNGEFVSYYNDYHSILYIPKDNLFAEYENQDTTEQKDLINFDVNKVIIKNYKLFCIGVEGLMDALNFIDGHSYIEFDGEAIIQLECEASPIGNGDGYEGIISFKREISISSNISNGTLTESNVNINPISTLDYDSDINGQVLINDVNSRLLFPSTVTNVALYKDGLLDTTYILSSTTLNGLSCKHVLNTSTLDSDAIYYYLIDGKKTACFRKLISGEINNERVIKIKVEHDGIIWNGSNPMHYEGVGYLEGIYKFYDNWKVLTEYETDETVNEVDLVRFKFNTVKKKWYKTTIITHPSSLNFLNFVDVNDTVTITYDGNSYSVWEFEVGEPDYLTSDSISIEIKWFIGEVTRARNGARALGVHGDYNDDYNNDYENY